jgi:RHS repeat-associated protein
MLTKGAQNLRWDPENRLLSITGNESASSFRYDDYGRRVIKTENGQTILYVNDYYEKNLTSREETFNYYFGGNLVAFNNNSGLHYILQDHLGSTTQIADSDGAVSGTAGYLPYGSPNFDDTVIAQKFTGQRLDGSGLYYYNARYYDPDLGRFISPDTIVQDPTNPQDLNRYTYCLNNPLKYTDPSGHGWWSIFTDIASVGFDIYQLATNPSWGNVGFLLGDVALTILPGVPAGLGPMAKVGKFGAEATRGFEQIKNVSQIASDTTKADRMAINHATGKVGEKLASQAIERAGYEIVGKQVTGYIKTANGRFGKRVIDILVKTKEGEYVAVEVKSGQAVRNAAQMEKDLMMETQGALFKGKNAPQELRGRTRQIKTIEWMVNF